jgi:hypothetical protein
MGGFSSITYAAALNASKTYSDSGDSTLETYIDSRLLTIGSFVIVTEEFTATASQTLFELSTETYDTDQPAFVFEGGAIQTSPTNFAKTSTSSFTMSEGVTEGTKVVFIGFRQTDYSGTTIVAVTTNKTLALTDGATYQNVTDTATITVPPNADVEFPVGTDMVFFKDTANEVTFAAGSGVTIKSESSKLKIDAQYTSVYLKKVATNTWHLSGSLKA